MRWTTPWRWPRRPSVDLTAPGGCPPGAATGYDFSGSVLWPAGRTGRVGNGSAARAGVTWMDHGGKDCYPAVRRPRQHRAGRSFTTWMLCRRGRSDPGTSGRYPASSGHWWFAGWGLQSSGQRTLAGAMSYVYCPWNSMVLPLRLNPEAQGKTPVPLIKGSDPNGTK